MSQKFAEFYCEDCDVQLHDDENFKNHLRGKPHLKQIQRIAEDRARRGLPNYHSSHARTGMSYHELPSQFSERIGQYYKENIVPKVEKQDHRRDSDYEDRRRSPRRSRSRSRSPRRRSRSPRKRYRYPFICFFISVKSNPANRTFDQIITGTQAKVWFFKYILNSECNPSSSHVCSLHGNG